jgi:hypothetical protein
MTKFPKIAGIAPILIFLFAGLMATIKLAGQEAKKGYFQGPEIFHLLQKREEELMTLRTFLRESWEMKRKSQINEIFNTMEGCLARGTYYVEKQKYSFIIKHDSRSAGVNARQRCVPGSLWRRVYDGLEVTTEGKLKLTNSKTQDSIEI